MNRKKHISTHIVVTAILTLATATPVPAAFAADAGSNSTASAEKAESVHVRGTIRSLEGSTLKVDSREGGVVDVMLNDGFKIAGIAKPPLTTSMRAISSASHRFPTTMARPVPSRF